MSTMQQIEEEISNMLEIPDEELTDEQRTAMDQYLDELADQEADKVDRFAAFIREEAAHAKFLKEESQRLASKARTAESRIGFLKSRYLSILQEHGLSKVRGNIYSLSIRNTPSVQVDDVSVLDDLYCRIVPEKREADKKAIAEYLKGGGTLPGCSIVQTTSLIIK